MTALRSTDGWNFTQLGSANDLDGVDCPTNPAFCQVEFPTGKVGLRTWGGLTANFDDVSVVADRTTYGYYTGKGWPGVIMDAGGSLEANKQFCVNKYTELQLG